MSSSAVIPMVDVDTATPGSGVAIVLICGMWRGCRGSVVAMSWCVVGDNRVVLWCRVASMDPRRGVCAAPVSVVRLGGVCRTIHAQSCGAS